MKKTWKPWKRMSFSLGCLLLSLFQIGLGLAGWISLPPFLGLEGLTGSYWVAAGFFVNLTILYAQAVLWGFVFGPSLRRDIVAHTREAAESSIQK